MSKHIFTIDILKNTDWIEQLFIYNDIIKQVHSKYTFVNTGSYDTNKNQCSWWFNPEKYRDLWLSNKYPNLTPIRHRPEYKLIMYLPNYLTLFLIKELYSDRKEVLIEDVGTGNGNLLFYLSKLKFNNFHAIDNWSQCCQSLFEDMMKAGDIKYKLNDLTTSPIITNACGSSFTFITPGLDKKQLYKYQPYENVDRNLQSLELICFYTNTRIEEVARTVLYSLGYTFLCKDKDDMCVAWCRNDKLTEFEEKLKLYVI